METATQKALEAIKQKAIEKWGARWLVDLTRAWCDRYAIGGDTNQNYTNRASQFTRILAGKVPAVSLEKVAELASCVDLELSLQDR